MAVTNDGTPYCEPGDAISAWPAVSQELAAVIDSLRTMIPVGAIFPYAGKVAPEGYLMCDGKAYTRADFYDLYTVMAEWVGEWGGFPGGNSAQFYVPDFRGRSPIGVGGQGDQIVSNMDLGSRYGDARMQDHYHLGNVDGGYLATFTDTSTGRTALLGPGPEMLYGASRTAYVSETIADWAGVGRNYHPITAVNFIVWTGTTTTGKNPVPGVELPPVTTRMMIEARLEEAGIGEEEIEMLREQLKQLETADA